MGTVTKALLGAVCLLLWMGLAQSIDCNACKYKPKAWQVDKAAKKAACKSANGAFSAIVAPVIAACANEEERLDSTGRLSAAVDMLVSSGAFTRADFNGVRIRWCNSIGSFAAGMVPDDNLILVLSTYKNTPCTSQLAATIAHEMVHVQQRRNWGGEGFGCRYAAEVSSGNGFERRNSVEREAYDREAQIAATLPKC